MGVLMWEKPKPVMSKEERASYQCDGGPPGSWMSNMSHEDSMRWKAKMTGKTTGCPQVELRRNGMVVILSKRGFKYKGYDCRQTEEWKARVKKQPKVAKEDPRVVHIASSASQTMTMQDYEDFMQALKEGWEALDAWDEGKELP